MADDELDTIGTEMRFEHKAAAITSLDDSVTNLVVHTSTV